MKYVDIIFIIIGNSLLLYTVMRYAAFHTKSRMFKPIRRLFWGIVKNKIIKMSNPLIAYPLAIEMSLNNTLKDTYINSGLDAFVDEVIVKTKEFLKTLFKKINDKRPSIEEWNDFDWVERKNLDREEEDFINNYQNKPKQP